MNDSHLIGGSEMIRSIFSQVFRFFTFLAVLALPLAVLAGDPLTVVDFNNRVFKISNEAVRKTLDEAGENSGRCDDMMVAVTTAMFQCKKDKEKCEERAAADGTPVVFCVNDTGECDPLAPTVAQNFFANSGGCKELKANVLRAGCGNSIAEFGEACDLGEVNGTPNAACSTECKTIAVQQDEGVGAPPVAAPVQAENNAAGGSCALHVFGNDDFPLWNLVALGIGTGLVLMKTTRRKHGVAIK